MEYCWLGPDFFENYPIENILRRDVSKVSIFRSSYDIFNASSSSKYVFVQSFPFLLSVCPNIRTGSGRTKDGRGMEKAAVDKEDWKLAHKLMIHTVEKENNLLFNVCYMLHVWFFNFKVGNFGRGRADFFLSLCEHKEEKRKDITQTALCLLPSLPPTAAEAEGKRRKNQGRKSTRTPPPPLEKIGKYEKGFMKVRFLRLFLSLLHFLLFLRQCVKCMYMGIVCTIYVYNLKHVAPMIKIKGIGLIPSISVVSKLPLIPIPEHGYERERKRRGGKSGKRSSARETWFAFQESLRIESPSNA